MSPATADEGLVQPPPPAAGPFGPAPGLVHAPNTKFMNFVGVRDHVATGVRTLLDIAHTERVSVALGTFAAALISSQMCRAAIQVPINLVGLVIGKKASTLKAVRAV